MKSKDDSAATEKDYVATLFLPSTDFPMRAGLPKKEPVILERWKSIDLYARQREQARGSPPYIVHDGPPYANGHLHIGHALNKILKDAASRSMQMLGHDANYVPGWDCHGLPIEWKVEECYRAEGRRKDDIPINEFRQSCRDFATHWLRVQRDEFERLGVNGAWSDHYTTMHFTAEAQIACELMKFATAGQLYRGSKPVMWSVAERTALAEAEVDYKIHRSDMIWVAFPLLGGDNGCEGACIVIWTTTPWTIPGNRAISFSSRIRYGLYKVIDAGCGHGSGDDAAIRPGMKFILADDLADAVMKQAGAVACQRENDVSVDMLRRAVCAHPLRDIGYEFDVPLLEGDHVTSDVGSGFVHTAPGHGMDDFNVWMENKDFLASRGVTFSIPHIVDADGFFTADAPGFSGRRVMTDKGDRGDANDAVIDALRAAGALVASGHLTHQYPHSWRSGKPIIFRNTPQWFISMDKLFHDGTTLRTRALAAIDKTRFIPENGRNRLRGMIECRPDWVVSRQRAWGVPISVFVNKATGALLSDPDVNRRIIAAFESEGADAWFHDGAKERFLGSGYQSDEWEKVDDILDVWFDSGASHAFVLERRDDLKWPADLYLEGSDQHRGWFQSSLLESCGTRGRAPYDTVLTHGFTMAGDGQKMSKSLNNQIFPGKIVEQYGADILRLWAMSVDYTDDQRIGAEILKSNADSYRRLRNVIRFLLGNLAGFDESETLPVDQMPELERWIFHRLRELDGVIRQGYRDFTYQRVFAALFGFMTTDLSSFYFDIRKDVLYCDSSSSLRRRACRTTLDRLFHCLTTWLAPMLCFTMEEAWTSRFPGEEGSIHLQLFPDVPSDWRDDALDMKFRHLRCLRRVVTGAIEVERGAGRVGSSLDVAPVLHVSDPELLAAMQGVDMAELCITSALTVRPLEEAAEDAFRLPEVSDRVAVSIQGSIGSKCARCWMILPEVGCVSGHTDVCRRCATVLDNA